MVSLTAQKILQHQEKLQFLNAFLIKKVHLIPRIETYSEQYMKLAAWLQSLA